MTYSELLDYLNKKYVPAVKFFIAEEVDRWSDLFPAEEYEDICDCVYSEYLIGEEEPDIYDLVQAELKARGYEE